MRTMVPLASVAFVFALGGLAAANDVVVDDGATNYRPVARNQPSDGSVWTSMAQTFVAEDSRIWFGFRFVFFPPDSLPLDAGLPIVYKLYDWDGAGPSAVLLATRTVSVPDSYTSDPRIVDLGFLDANFTDVPLVVGHTYTMVVTVPPENYPVLDDATRYGVWTSLVDPYPGGRFFFLDDGPYFFNSYFVDQDMLFRMTVPCGDGVLQSPQECDDGNTVSHDGCNESCIADCLATPREDCRSAAVSTLLIKHDAVDGSRDVARWKWSHGAATAAFELSDPTAGGRYNVCLYPNDTLGGEILLPSDTGWSSNGESGYEYADKAAAVGGVTALKIHSGVAGKSQIVWKARGSNLPDTLLPATSYRMQLVDSQSGLCWDSTFASGAVKPGQFKAKSAP